MPFVDDFLEYTKDCESPTSYFKWTAYTALAAALRDNCYIRRHDGTVYPNMYTVLLSQGSSHMRKSVPMKKMVELFKEAKNTKIIEGRASFQAALEQLAMPDVDRNGNPIKGASCFMYTEELRSFFVDDPQLIVTLTNIYDFHRELPITLKSGKAKLSNVCVTFLGATNDEYFKSFFTREAIMGGLLARTFVIVERKRRKKDSGMYSPPPDQGLAKKLILHLREISRIQGEFEISQQAKRLYDDWYNTIDDEKYSDTGVEARIHTGVLKLAMVISVNERTDRKITIDHMEKAIEECIGILHNYKSLGSAATTPEGQNARLVLELLLTAQNHEMTTMDLLNALWGSIDKMALDKVIETFYAAEIITTVTKGSTIKYRLTARTIEEFNKAAIKKAEREKGESGNES